MNKISLFCIVLGLVLLLTGCSQSQADTNIDTQAKSEAIHETEKPLLHTALYQTAEDLSAFSSGNLFSPFEAKEYVNADAAPSLEMTINETTYTFVYESSEIMARANLSVDIYKSTDASDVKIFVNTLDGSVVKYVDIPYDNEFTTEAACIDFIKHLVEPDLDLSTYDYRCATHYYSHENNSFRSILTPDFHVCSDTEEFGSYEFYYTKSISNITTAEHITAILRDDSFTLEIYDIGYTDEFAELINISDKYEVELETYFRTNMDDDKIFKDHTMGNKELFVKDGVPYLLITSLVEFTMPDSSDETYTTVVVTIHWITQNTQTEATEAPKTDIKTEIDNDG